SPGNHPEQGKDRGAVADLDAGHRSSLLIDGIHEIGPEEREVVAVGLLQLRFFMNRRVAIVTWIKGPPVTPADVENSIGPVEVSADGMFFRGIPREPPVFPDTSKVLKFVGGDLMIRRIGGLLFFVEHGGAGDGTAARAKNTLGIFLFGPPKDLIQPVDT